MPEIFLEFIGDASPWWLPLLIVLAVWGKLNWDALNNPAKKASFERAVEWLREDSFGQLYLRFLSGLMDRVGDWIGDRRALSQGSMTVGQPKGLVQRVFGFNPFTAQSYEKCLWLAFMYPVFAYLLAWAMGAEGQVGEVSLFMNEAVTMSIWQRWAVMSGIVLSISLGLWFLWRRQCWKQWVAMGSILLLTAGIVNGLGSKMGIAELFLVLVFIFLFSFLSLYLGGWLAGLMLYRSLKAAHQGIYKPAFALALALAGALAIAIKFAGTFTNPVAFASAFAIAFVVAFSSVGAGAGTFAFAATFAGVLAFVFALAKTTVFTGIPSFAISGIIAGISIAVLHALQQWSERRENAYWFWTFYNMLLIVLGIISLSINARSGYMLFVLLWLLLPLVNAPLDWLSLGVTRGLLQAVRTGNHSGWRALAWAGTDLLLALIFLFLITAVLVGVTALGNAIAGQTLIDIGCILNKVHTDTTHPDHWWIYFMLLSTLIPTLFHFALAGGAATLWLPRQWRMQLADGLEDDMHKTFGAWVYLTFTPVVGFVLVPLALLGSLWWLLNTNSGALGMLLLSWAENLALWADPGMELTCKL